MVAATSRHGRLICSATPLGERPQIGRPNFERSIPSVIRHRQEPLRDIARILQYTWRSAHWLRMCSNSMALAAMCSCRVLEWRTTERNRWQVWQSACVEARRNFKALCHNFHTLRNVPAPAAGSFAECIAAR
jgi:hypothetical protein